MAKKFAEITGIHRIFKSETLNEEPNNGTTVYTEMFIDDDEPELQENIDKNTIVFVTADNDDEGRIIGPNNYKISKDDCFIIAQNKVYATFGKVNVSDVMGPTGKDGITPEIGGNGNWFIGDEDTGIHAQGPQGNPGPVGSQYIQTDLNDESFLEDALNIIQSNNISIGDYSISKDTNTIWKCISNTEFSQGPTIKGEQGPPGTSLSMPVGSVIMFAVDDTPDGWVFCKGQRIKVSNDGSFTCTDDYMDFQELVNKIGTKYGTTYTGGTDVFDKPLDDLDEDGDTCYIQIPDFSLRFPYGASDNNTLGSTGGASTVTLENKHIPYHTHGITIPDVNSPFTGTGTAGANDTSGGEFSASSLYTTNTMDGSVSRDAESFNIIPNYTTINFIIKYK